MGAEGGGVADEAYGSRKYKFVQRVNYATMKDFVVFIDGLTGFKSAAFDPSRIGHFFAALANELRVLGVTTFVGGLVSIWLTAFVTAYLVLLSRRDVRSARTSTGASSQMVIARSLSSSRVRGST